LPLDQIVHNSYFVKRKKKLGVFKKENTNTYFSTIFLFYVVHIILVLFFKFFNQVLTNYYITFMCIEHLVKRCKFSHLYEQMLVLSFVN